jgi:sulfur-oxidizing protein SoxY
MREGRVRLDVSPLVENGNAVPISVTVETPMTAADHVRRIGVFNERNPQPNVITAQFGPRSGRAFLATHIRLATSQALVAVAEMNDGSFWSQRVEVIVTLAACIEG